MIRKILKSRCQGITLIELLCVIMILAVALVPMFALYNQAIRNNATTEVMTILAYTAQFGMESALSGDFFNLPADTRIANRIPMGQPGTFMNQFYFSCWVESIDPDYAGNLSDDQAKVEIPQGMDTSAIDSNYYRIHVIAENDILPEKSIELWTIVTSAEAGY